MTDESNQPTSMAEEVAKRVLESLEPKFDEIRGELRSKVKGLGEDIDAINARLTADKASVDSQIHGLRQDLSRHSASVDDQLNGLRQDISRLSTTTKATLDSHTSRFRAIPERLDTIDGRLDRIERGHVPAE